MIPNHVQGLWTLEKHLCSLKISDDVRLPNRSDTPAADADCSSDHPQNSHRLQKMTWMMINAGNADVLNNTTNKAVPQT